MRACVNAHAHTPTQLAANRGDLSRPCRWFAIGMGDVSFPSDDLADSVLVGSHIRISIAYHIGSGRSSRVRNVLLLHMHGRTSGAL